MKSKKEVNLLIIIFVIIGILGIAIKSFEFYNIKIISATTTDIYEHPLKVSNATLTIKLNIYKIHRDMKDIVLSLSNEELAALVEEVNKHELYVYENFSIIEQNILGDDGLKLTKKTKELFDAWKPIRNEVISLVKNAKRDDAIAITKGKGAKHVLKLGAAAIKLHAYAKNNAVGFKNSSESSFKTLETINFSITILFFFLYSFIGYYIIDRISKYISKNEHLNNILSVISDVNQLIGRAKDPQALIQDSCNILISTHIYSNAWIVTYNEHSEIEYIASTYTTKNFTSFKEKLNQAWTPYCIHKTVNANGLHSYIKNTEKSCSVCPLSHDYSNKGAFNIALKYEERLYGYLTLSIDTDYVNYKDELALLDQVAGDIAYALYNLENERRLIVQEERYRYVIEGTTNGLWDLDLLNNNIYFSSRWKEMLGYRDDELQNSFITWKDRVHPDDLALALADMQVAQESASGHYRNIHRLKHKEGHWVWIDARGQSLFDENNRAIRMIGSHTDVTKEKLAEDEIIYLKELYNNIIDSVENIIFVKDTNFVYITCNQAFEKFVGSSKDQIIGKTDYDLFNKNVADFFREHDELMLLQSESKSNFEWIAYPDGQNAYLLTVKSPLLNEEGHLLGLVGNSADFTEQKEIEQALAESNRQLTSLMNNLPGIAYRCMDDERWTMTFLSDGCENLTGYASTDILNNHLISYVDLIHPDDREMVRNEVKSSLKEHRSFETEYRLITAKGEVQWVWEYGSGIYTDENEYIFIEGVILDINARKKVEKELLISNNKFEKAFNSTPNIIIISNLQTGKFYEINKTCENILGYSREELISKTTFDINLWVDFNDRTEYIETLKIKGSIENAIYSFNKKNGDEIIVSVYASIVTIDNEEYILTIADDITQEYKTKELLHQKKQELETIFNEAPTPMAIHNEDGEIIMINKVWEELTGYKHSEIDTISKWTDKVVPEHSDLRKEHIEGMYNITERVDEGEFEIMTKSGETIIWVFSSAPLGVMDGKRVLISSATDITELKKKDELMITQSRHAAMGEMIGMIAHQWRQPLTVISMDTNNMLVDIALNELNVEHVKEYSNNIQIQTKNLSKTIDDFRNFFKPDKSILKVKLQDILEDTYTIIKDNLKSNDITLNTSYTSESEVSAYPRELMQVFVNIINNSKDALMLKEREDAQIDITVFEDDEYVITEICDNGDGINEAILPKIFDPYFTTKDKSTGTGLGLYMSKMIIDDHLHGIIEAYNQNDGVCFRVKLRKET